jgi:hypothetical protein
VKALSDSDALLVLVSDQAQQSDWVQREIHMSVKKKRPILPVWTSPQPGRMSQSFEFLLGPLQFAALGPSAVDELPQRLHELLARNDGPTRSDSNHAAFEPGVGTDQPMSERS